jgi:hypothetical protein
MSVLMDRALALGNAAEDRPPDGAVRCVLPQVEPTIVIAPKIVLVRKPQHDHPHRVRVTLGTTPRSFTGTGTLSSPQADVRIFRTRDGGNPLPMPWTGIPGADLSAGTTVWAEGLQASNAVNGTRLELALAGGDKAIVRSPAHDEMTCIDVTLDLCVYKPATGGIDPAPMVDKIAGGRNLHLQTPGYWAGRALLIVRQVLPLDYTGQVTLRAQNNRVRIFPYLLHEIAAVGQVATVLPLTIGSLALAGDGGKFWVEGVRFSNAVLDTGFTLEAVAVAGFEADRANLTVVKATFDAYDMPTRERGTQTIIADNAKMNPGRALMAQDGGTHFDRARIVVKRVEPGGLSGNWIGNLEVQVWDVPNATALNPKARLFNGRDAAAAATVFPLRHPDDISYIGGKDLWVEGAIESAQVRDTELRLRVADAEGSADRVAVTVNTLRVREIYFHGIRDIYYARIPTVGSYLLTPPVDAPATHIDPEAVRPAAGSPHWRRLAGATDNAEISWPAAYVRRGGAGAPAPDMEASFDLFPQAGNNVTMRIRARAEGATPDTELQDVAFVGGVSQRIRFPLDHFPNTVARLDGNGAWRFRWFCDGWGPTTQHTLFFTDRLPRRADNAGVNQYLWEIFEWSCDWANGVTGTNNVFGQIWARFSPVAGAHATGLIYWKNQHLFPNASQVMAQNLPDAIRSHEHANVLLQDGATCIVFDRVLINCCTAHGIDAAEVKLKPQVATFNRLDPNPPGAMVNWQCRGWNDTTIIGQGNVNSPPVWGSHWIASVKLTGLIFDSWYYYDASYGVAPVDSPVPGAVNAAIDPFNYEPLTVQSFICQPSVGGIRVNFPAAAGPPRLVGQVLFNSR